MLSIAVEGEIIDVPWKRIFYPGVALLAVAAIGTLLTRKAAPADAVTEQESPRGGVAVRAVGFGSTALAVAVALIVLGDDDDPCVGPVSDSIDTLVTISWIAAGLAALAGLASLVQRRWFGALIMLGAGPFAALLAALTSVCWN